ncbi:MAG: hypothetical protein HKL80_12295 [Acidimicrobiales bacterium]|nr:hypothetical protein [Acidimicrobiales bacterium]
MKRVAFLVCSLTLFISLSACSTSDALSLARQACTYVQSSINQYNAATKNKDPKAASVQYASALLDLRKAEPLASIAAGEDTQWQALQATLSESSRVPEKNLIYSLTQQCQSAKSGGV